MNEEKIRDNYANDVDASVVHHFQSMRRDEDPHCCIRMINLACVV